LESPIAEKKEEKGKGAIADPLVDLLVANCEDESSFWTVYFYAVQSVRSEQC
jgi:hypothetical protein